MKESCTKTILELVRREPSFILKDYRAKDGWIALQRSVYIEDLTRTYFFDSIRGPDVTMRTLQVSLETSFS